ncbi:MAG: hypothetical protein C5B50_04150 [Verrucomicrobia bacterium]|nr:MAG: hypothetical protein C5B50_04150 [Verrucomicrobiota bacterium]
MVTVGPNLMPFRDWTNSLSRRDIPRIAQRFSVGFSRANVRVPKGRLTTKLRGVLCLTLALVIATAIWTGLCLSASGSQVPFISPNAVVVLLSGLPGDVESENDYKDNLEGWLKIVRDSGQAQRVIALADGAESGPTPSKAGATVIKANRDNFKALCQTVAGTTNPLVVIAWGHGGRQGSTPVFHVRGPRLMPTDFKALAECASRTDSEWVLFFRGSGAFARDLAGARRQILSSECETVFNSDPAGMSLLLKLARANLSQSFQSLSAEFGRALGAWYEERHLARTEEPTLWLAEQKPQLLAPASENVADTAAAQTTNTSDQTPNTKHQIPNKLQAPEPNGDLGTNGTEIADNKATGSPYSAATNSDSTLDTRHSTSDGFPPRVQPQDYPGAVGVVLRRHLAYTLGNNPAIASEQDEYIQILSPEGKHLGDFDIAYSAPFEDIAFLDCEVLHADGKIERLDPEAIREAREPTVGDYQTGQRKFFSLPGVVPGAVLHVRYRTQWKQFPLPHISLEIPVDQSLPAVDCSLEVRVPREAPFHYTFENIRAPDPTVEQTTYGTRYGWHFSKLEERDRELLSSPRHDARLLVSTFHDWGTFSEWYQRISKLADEITPEISAKAKELTREAPDKRAKVLAVYDFVASLRYVAVPMGVNSFRPHAAAHVLENQFGDCKDKANLFNTLLRALNIEAELTLVPRFSQAHDDLPGLAFNHAISKVILDNQTLWIDTTDEVCRFGMLPPGDPGRKVLVIAGSRHDQAEGGSADGSTHGAGQPRLVSTGRNQGKSGLTQLPVPDAKDHVLKLRGRVNCSAPGATLPMSLEATATGFPDYELRAAARGAKEQNASVPLLAAKFRPAAGTFALEDQRATPVSNLDEDFRWDADGQSVGLCWSDDRTWLLHSPFWLPKQWDQALHHRKSALFLNDGYPLTLEQEFDFELPPGTQIKTLPAAAESKAQPFRWRIEWKKSGALGLTAHFNVELERGELSQSETPLFQQQLRELLGAMAANVVISK